MQPTLRRRGPELRGPARPMGATLWEFGGGGYRGACTTSPSRPAKRTAHDARCFRRNATASCGTSESETCCALSASPTRRAAERRAAEAAGGHILTSSITFGIQQEPIPQAELISSGAGAGRVCRILLTLFPVDANQSHIKGAYAAPSAATRPRPTCARAGGATCRTYAEISEIARAPLVASCEGPSCRAQWAEKQSLLARREATTGGADNAARPAFGYAATIDASRRGHV